MKILKKEGVEFTNEFKIVENIAEDLKRFLNQEEIRSEISKTHKVGAKSSEIQKIFIEKAEELGFQSEKNGLFAGYQSKALRPDFFMPLDNSSGIIMEVERGKTITNNMDLLDVWKCHICENANYLFLIIPMMRQNNKGGETSTFKSVVKRLDSFFVKGNYINVKAIFIFGY